MGNSGVTEQQVFSVASELMRKGIEPSTKLVREKLKTGSLSTISKHLRKWREGQGSSSTVSLSANSRIDVPPEALAELLQFEHPQTIAVVLSTLEPEISAQIVRSYPNEMQASVVRRIANIGPVEPRILNIVIQCLRQEIESREAEKANRSGGREYVEKLLSHLDEKTKTDLRSAFTSKPNKVTA